MGFAAPASAIAFARCAGLISTLDRIRADFDVGLTGERIDAHFARYIVKRAEWSAANAARNLKSESRHAEAICS